jgi:hypothetical protein
MLLLLFGVIAIENTVGSKLIVVNFFQGFFTSSQFLTFCFHLDINVNIFIYIFYYRVFGKKSFFSKASFSQGDQIGRIFAHWAVIFFGHLLNCNSSPTFSATFFPAVQVIH